MHSGSSPREVLGFPPTPPRLERFVWPPAPGHSFPGEPMPTRDADETLGVPRLTGSEPDWLTAFHAGHREALEQCYREHFVTVERSVGRHLSAADRDTLIHEVFYRLLSDAELRHSFRGGSFAAWISRVAANQAIDYRRRLQRETPLEGSSPLEQMTQGAAQLDDDIDARSLIEAFRKTRLPAKWAPVFEARFIRQLDQHEAARSLEMRRTTLAYQEHRIGRLLRRFLLESRKP